MTETETAHAGLITTLQNDAGVLAWLATHNLGAAFTVLDGTRAVVDIPPEQRPALVLAAGASVHQAPTLGYDEQEQEEGVAIGFVWDEQDRTKAIQQKRQLKDLIVKALLANARLGGAVSYARVQESYTDNETTHPVHAINFLILCTYSVQR